jgi:hypothetical protein
MVVACSSVGKVTMEQSELREAAFRVCEEDKVIWAMGLINRLSKACFAREFKRSSEQRASQYA